MPLAYGLTEPHDLPLPSLPPALEGLRIAHITDLHARRPARLYHRLADQLTRVRLDLLVLTGDYIDKPGQEEAGYQVLRRLVESVQPRLGTFGVFGNHDTPALRDRCAGLPVRWLTNAAVDLPDQPIRIMGLDMLDYQQPDAVALAIDQHPPESSPAEPARDGRLCILLAHTPSCLTTAADLGAHLFLAGHTHGGQCRLPTGHALINSSDLPLNMSAGLLRHRDTLAVTSRGVGHAGYIPRIFCRPHVPIYNLRRRTMPGETTGAFHLVRYW